MKPRPIPPGPGQESVWDYPRPPRLERSGRHLELYFGGLRIADTTRALRVLETSHPPTYYLPLEDIVPGVLEASERGSFCEWKGQAIYSSLRVGQAYAPDIAWSYPRPSGAFAALEGHLAFYAAPLERCLVDGVQVIPQPGGFYGGWITPDVVGPFKGIPGSMGW